MMLNITMYVAKFDGNDFIKDFHEKGNGIKNG